MPVYYLLIPVVGVAVNSNEEGFMRQVTLKEAKMEREACIHKLLFRKMSLLFCLCITVISLQSISLEVSVVLSKIGNLAGLKIFFIFFALKQRWQNTVVALTKIISNLMNNLVFHYTPCCAVNTAVTVILHLLPWSEYDFWRLDIICTVQLDIICTVIKLFFILRWILNRAKYVYVLRITI